MGGRLLGEVESLPLAGHAAGIVHYIRGDRDRGDQAIISATKGVAFLAGGIGGAAIGVFGTLGTVSSSTALIIYLLNRADQRMQEVGSC